MIESRRRRCAAIVAPALSHRGKTGSDRCAFRQTTAIGLQASALLSPPATRLYIGKWSRRSATMRPGQCTNLCHFPKAADIHAAVLLSRNQGLRRRRICDGPGLLLRPGGRPKQQQRCCSPNGDRAEATAERRRVPLPRTVSSGAASRRTRRVPSSPQISTGGPGREIPAPAREQVAGSRVVNRAVLPQAPSLRRRVLLFPGSSGPGRNPLLRGACRS